MSLSQALKDHYECLLWRARVDNLLDLRHAERMEHHDIVDTVEELGAEGHHRLPLLRSAAGIVDHHAWSSDHAANQSVD